MTNIPSTVYLYFMFPGVYRPKIGPKSLFIGQILVFCRYCTQNVKDGTQSQVYIVNNESVNHFSHFISVKVKKIQEIPMLNFGKS